MHEKLINKLALEVEEILSDAPPLDAIENAFLNRDENYLKIILAENNDDENVIDKMLYHYENKQKKDSKINIKNLGDYLVIRSEMYSSKKEKYSGDGLYHAVWIIGKDSSQKTGLFIHRLQWQDYFENDDYTWSIEGIKNIIGFDYDIDQFNETFIQPELNKIYRIQGDLTIKKSYTMNNYYNELHDNYRIKIKESINRQTSEEYTEKINNKLQNNNNLNDMYFKVFASSSTITMKLFGGSTNTEKLKKLQDKLEITEDEIRKKQKEHDLKKLSQRKRQEFIEDIVSQKAEDLCKEINTEEKLDTTIQEEMKKVKNRLENGKHQKNFVIGNHLIIFANAYTKSNLDITRDIIVPIDSYVYFIHNEHDNKYIKLQNGIYDINLLHRHIRG